MLSESVSSGKRLSKIENKKYPPKMKGNLHAFTSVLSFAVLICFPITVFCHLLDKKMFYSFLQNLRATWIMLKLNVLFSRDFIKKTLAFQTNINRPNKIYFVLYCFKFLLIHYLFALFIYLCYLVILSIYLIQF